MRRRNVDSPETTLIPSPRGPIAAADGRRCEAGRSRGAAMLGAAVVAAAAALVVAAAGEAAARPEARGVRDFCAMVPMRDGTPLATDVYVPRWPRGAYPVILVRTPDGKHEVTRLMARYVCRRGFALVVQDVRGRHASPGGPTMVFLHDGWGEDRDGVDTIRWIARQPWCDGRVAMWGASAIGFLALLAAPDAPPALCAEHVTMVFSDMYLQAAYQGGALRQELVEGWLRRHGYAEINLRTLLDHHRYDDFWAQMAPVRQAHRVNTPIVFLAGWHDAFLQGTLDMFEAVESQGGPRARGRCRLIVGPWSHDDVRRLADPRNAARYPPSGDVVRWFEDHLRGECGGTARDRAVHYYVSGDSCDRNLPAHRWRSAEHWPPRATETPYYLLADESLATEPSREPGSRTYRFDPKNPAPTLGGRNLNLPSGPCDQRPVESRSDVLLFTGPPLEKPLEVTGRILAELFISSDCPDTDFTVKLTDVCPDGRSLLVADGILRARFRESFAEEKFLEPGRVYRIPVDLWSASYVFGSGHRLRVAVSSSNAPRFEPNPNNGEPHLGGSNPPRTATNTVYCSEQYPSRIVLPIVRAEEELPGDAVNSARP